MTTARLTAMDRDVILIALHIAIQQWDKLANPPRKWFSSRPPEIVRMVARMRMEDGEKIMAALQEADTVVFKKRVITPEDVEQARRWGLGDISETA